MSLAHEGRMAVVYRLELQVTEQGAPYYPPLGSIEYLSPDNAGYDLKVAKTQEQSDVAVLVPLGVKARMIRMSGALHEDCHFTLEPRSSIYKTGFMMANSRGIIDKTYRGELMAPMLSVGSNAKPIEAGTRLFQIIAPDMGFIGEVAYVDSIPENTSRGSNGFGSTGSK